MGESVSQQGRSSVRACTVFAQQDQSRCPSTLQHLPQRFQPTVPFDSNSRILITGGTGSFGKAFIAETFRRFPDIKRLVVYSRDELKQWELQQIYPEKQYPQLRFFLGDVRDRNRLQRALEGIDTVVHAAALKQVPAAEYNPIEFINTNVLGAENVVQACLDTSVQRVVALSTDKAAAPINLYGASKLCSDKLFIAANNIRGFRDLRFSVVRYGNVMGSRGSVIPYFLQKAKSGILPITDPTMTRFNISLREGVDMVLWALEKALGGELFVPKIPSYRITDVAEAIGPNCKKPIIGIRPGEKIHEEMITSSDSFTTIDLGDYFAILPSDGRVQDLYTKEGISLHAVAQGFAYNSGTNPEFLSVEQLRHLIREHVDPSFEPR
jgi:UDP-N-acetylglucosamine 4,6-dehydratase